MSLLLPFMAFLFGYWGVEYLKPLRPMLAMLLARVLIPAVIIYNMVFYQAGTIWLLLFSLCSSIVLFGLYYFCRKDALHALCFSYLNGVWLGFPFALALFGPAASHSIVALYIGGSLFGNVAAVMALSSVQPAWKSMLVQVLKSPPVIALSIAGILSFWDFSAYQTHPLLQWGYWTNKVLVTFTGMCILGMWLSKVRIALPDVIQSIQTITIRLVLALGLIALAYEFLPIPHQALTYAVILMYFLLPPAANIVALETYYQGTGDSAKTIAAGTIASALLIALYAVLVHVFMPSHV